VLPINELLFEIERKKDTDDERTANISDLDVARDSNVWLLAQDYKKLYHSNFEAILAVFRVSPLLWPFYYLFKGNFRFFHGLEFLLQNAEQKMKRSMQEDQDQKKLNFLEFGFIIVNLLL